MNRVNYILQSVNVLNSLLIAVITLAVYFIMIPVSDFDAKLISPVKDTVAVPLEKHSLSEKIQASDYALIGDQNIFHPERKIPPEKKEEKTVPRPEVILYGTLITQQESVAFIEDKKTPRTTPGRGKRQTALHKGDILSGYILAEITPDSVVLTKGEERIVVRLEEGEKRKTSETSLLPAQNPMISGDLLPASQKTAPVSSPAAKVTQVTSPHSQTGLSPVPMEEKDGPVVRLPSRRNAAQLEVMKKKERARQLQMQ